MNICIFSALPAEISMLVGGLGAVRRDALFGISHAFEARHRSSTILMAALGAGIASAAMGMGIVLASVRPDFALMVGSAGYLPESDLKPGDLFLSSSEIFAELGIEYDGRKSERGFLALPGLTKEVPLDPALTDALLETASRFRRTLKGPSITVAGVSGDMETARSRARVFSALSENMEGYALALAGEHFHIPVAEIRGISNEAGDRERAHWNLHTALEGAQIAVMAYLENQVL